MKRIFLFLFLSILLIGIVNAEVQSMPTQKQGECISLEQTCSSCTYVNVDSVKYPNSSREFFNDAMTNNGGYGYSYDFCKTNQTGNYIVTTCGDVDGTDTCVDYDFEVTPSGMIQSTSQGIMSIVIIISIIFVTFFFGALSFKLMDYDKLYPIAIFFLVLSIIIAVFGMYLGFTYSRDYLYAASTAPYGKLFVGVLISLSGVAFIMLLFLIISGVKEISEAGKRRQYGENYNTRTKSYEN
jgi:hypothetical protein